MKTLSFILSAAVLTFCSCDKEKVEEAKTKTAEAGKAVGELAKDTGSKVYEKGKELAKDAAEKLKGAKNAISEKSSPALDTFKAKIGGYSESLKQMEGKAGDDPAKAKQMLENTVTKLKAISADGVPSDLKEAFENYQGAMSRLLTAMKPSPTEAAAFEEWVKVNADKLHALEQDTAGAAKLFKEAAARHGLTGLNLGD